MLFSKNYNVSCNSKAFKAGFFMKIKKEKKYQTNLVHKVLQVSLKTTRKKETNEKMEKTFP